MMSITGTAETAPLRVGFPVCDSVGGLTAALAISAALLGRQRTGEGAFLDVSMLEASLSAMGWAVSNYLVGGVDPEPMGDQNATAAPSGTFDDGRRSAQHRRQPAGAVREAVPAGRPGGPGDRPPVRRRDARKRHRTELDRELNGRAAHPHRRGVGAGARRRRRAGRPDPDRAAGGRAGPAAPPRASSPTCRSPAGPRPAAADRRATASWSTVRRCTPTGPPPLLGQHNASERAVAPAEDCGAVTDAVADWWGTAAGRARRD